MRGAKNQKDVALGKHLELVNFLNVLFDLFFQVADARAEGVGWFPLEKCAGMKSFTYKARRHKS